MLPIPAGLGPESAGSLITCRATRHRGDRQSLDLTDAGAARVDSVEVFGLSGTGVDTLVLVRQSRGKDAAAIIRLIACVRSSDSPGPVSTSLSLPVPPSM